MINYIRNIANEILRVKKFDPHFKYDNYDDYWAYRCGVRKIYVGNSGIHKVLNKLWKSMFALDVVFYLEYKGGSYN